MKARRMNICTVHKYIHPRLEYATLFSYRYCVR